MINSEWKQHTIDQILSICGLDGSFNFQARGYLESLQPTDLMEMLAAANKTVNLARRHLILTETNIADNFESGEFQTKQISPAYSKLLELKAMPSDERAALGFVSYIEAVCSALHNLAEQATADEILTFHQNYLSFFRWVENLSLAHSDIDARIEYWRVLATTQRKVKGRGAPNLDLLWRRILLASGSQYPLHYSEVALLGFCWSERSVRATTFAPVISTFVGWAHSADLEEEYYKTLSRHFVSCLERSLSSKDSQEPWTAFDIAMSEIINSRTKYVDWLREVLSEKGAVLSGKHRRGSSRVPTKRELNLLISALGRLTEAEGVARVEMFYRAYSEHTWQSGNVELLGSSLTRMAVALLENPTYASSTNASMLIRDMAIELIRWQPNHISGWTLWIRILVKNRKYRGVESILWETIRRFPDSKIFRNQLADIQIDQRRYCEAEYLLRLNIEDFPTDGASYQKLARLLALQPNRLEEAILIGNGASKILGYSAKTLTRVLRRISSTALGNEALFFPRPSVQELLNVPLTGGPNDEIISSIVLHARAMLAQFQLTCPGLGAEETSASLLTSLVQNNNLPFARFLLTRALPNYDAPDKLMSEAFSTAFVKAIASSNPTNWEALSENARSQESRWLVRVAESLLDSAPENTLVVGWLKGETSIAGRIPRILRRRLLALIKDIDIEVDLATRLSKQRRQVVKILGDTAAVLFDEEIAA